MRFFPTMGIWRLPLNFQINPCQLPRWRWPNLCLDNSALPPSRRPVLTFCCGDLWRLLVWYLMFKQIKNKQIMFFPCWSHSSWSYSIQPLCSEFQNCGRHAPLCAEGRRHLKIKNHHFPHWSPHFEVSPFWICLRRTHLQYSLVKSMDCWLNPIQIPLKFHWNPIFAG